MAPDEILEVCINIPEVEGRAREQCVKMSGMIRENANMNLPRS